MRRIAKYKDQVTLARMDTKAYILETLPRLPFNSLVNIDPPYYGKGRDLYCSFYDHADHVGLSKVIPKIRQRWMVTYDDAPAILELYRKLPTMNLSLNYSAQVKRVGIELMILDPKLVMPAGMGQAA